MKYASTPALPALGTLLALVSWGALLHGQTEDVTTALAPPSRPSSEFGDPLPGLTEEQMDAFLEGQEQFEEAETPEIGLGPIFNNVSCVSCHSVPAVGGSSGINETRFGRTVNGAFDPLANLGGSLLQLFAIEPACQEFVPAEANVMAQRQSTPLFGLGLVEAIPNRTLLLLAASPKPDGVQGRAAIVQDVATGQSRVGRFGWKAQIATLLSFSGDAYLNEMGITSRLFPQENAPNGDTNLLAICDRVPDPEDEEDPVTGKADIDSFTDFMRFLGPPPTTLTPPILATGPKIFIQVGCAVCHTPALTTGPNQVAALDRKLVPLFSDLLLHDMGALADGIAQAAAGPSEMRTAPLWGLRASAPYLHDGRAATVDDAIRAHDGEASVARDRFLRLNDNQREQLLRFLNSI